MKRIIRNIVIAAPFAFCLQLFLDGSPYWVKLVLGIALSTLYLLLINELNDKDNAN